MAKALNLNVSVFVLTLLTALMTLTRLTPELSRADSLREEIREFHGFLNDHPRIANQLQRDPWLVNNPGYLNDHEELRRFLRHHPRVRQEFLAKPGRVLGYASYGYASNSRPYFQGYPPYDYRRYEDQKMTSQLAKIVKIDSDEPLVFGWANVAVRKDGTGVVDSHDHHIHRKISSTLHTSTSCGSGKVTKCTRRR